MKYYITIVVVLMSILAIGYTINVTAPTTPATPAPATEDSSLKNLKL